MYTDFMNSLKMCCLTTAASVCFALPPAYGAESDAQALVRLRGEISELIGKASCRNLVVCRVVGLGVRPCGGPEEYIAYSIWNTDRAAIVNRVSEYNLLKEDLMLDNDEAGTCEQLPEPNVDCVHARCVTVPAAN